MTVPTVIGTQLAGRPDLRCWCAARRWGRRSARSGPATAELLSDPFHVAGWDLPGHGASSTAHEP